MGKRIDWDKVRKERQIERSEASYRPFLIGLSRDEVSYWDKAAEGLLSRRQLRRLKK